MNRSAISFFFFLLVTLMLTGCEAMFSAAVHSTVYLAEGKVPIIFTEGGGKVNVLPWNEQNHIPKMILDKNKLASVQSVVLLEIPNPPYFVFNGRKVVPTPFIKSKDEDAESDSPVKKEENPYPVLDFSTVTQNKLTTLLEARGYKVIPVSLKRRKQYKLLKDYQELEIPAVDAILDLVPIKIGYNWEPMWGKMRTKEVSPYIAIAVRMVALDTREVIYEESINYDFYPKWTAAATKIRSSADQNFPELNKVMEQKEKAKKRLAHGIDIILNNIVEKISPDDL